MRRTKALRKQLDAAAAADNKAAVGRLSHEFTLARVALVDRSSRLLDLECVVVFDLSSSSWGEALAVAGGCDCAEVRLLAICRGTLLSWRSLLWKPARPERGARLSPNSLYEPRLARMLAVVNHSSHSF